MAVAGYMGGVKIEETAVKEGIDPQPRSGKQE
jgi:hypothetical protein